jgi:hypothetical protein
VAVASEVRVGVAAEEVERFAVGVEGEAGENAGRGIELGFVEDDVTAGRNVGAVADAELLREGRVVAQEPPADAWPRWSWD